MGVNPIFIHALPWLA